MTAWLKSLTGILSALGVLAGFLGLRTLRRSARRDGREEAEADQKERVHEATEAMLRADVPDDRDDAARRLRDGTF